MQAFSCFIEYLICGGFQNRYAIKTVGDARTIAIELGLHNTTSKLQKYQNFMRKMIHQKTEL